jgi:hypothetical protein
MRGIYRTASELTIAALIMGHHTPSVADKADAKALAALGQKLAALPPDGNPTALDLGKDIKLTVERDGFSLCFVVAVDAYELAEAFGWARPFGISTDVHQRRWQLALYAGDLADAHNHRIATTTPQLGQWRARAELDGRPAGALPPLVAGASPAYEFPRYHATVKVVRLTRQP